MPRLHFTAQVLIKHRLEEKVVVVVDERGLEGVRQVESCEKPPKSTAYDQYLCAICRHF